MINILITGAGSVMGQSIYRALQYSSLKEQIKVYFTNSDAYGAGLYFSNKQLKPDIVKTFIVPLANDHGYIEKINEIVKSNNIHIIFSGTQHELMKLAEYGDKTNIVAAMPSALLPIALDKYQTAQFFIRHQIAGLQTTLLRDLKISNLNLHFPFIIKPRSSSSSRNITLIENADQFAAYNARLKKEELDKLIVQEYVTGTEYTCGCYIDKFTHLIETIIFQRELTSDGATGIGKVISDNEITNYLHIIAKAYIKEGLKFGHLNIQLRKNATDHQPYCFEINGRLSSTESPKAALGFNSVEAYIYNIVLEKSYNFFKPHLNKQFIRYYDEVFFE